MHQWHRPFHRYTAVWLAGLFVLTYFVSLASLTLVVTGSPWAWVPLMAASVMFGMGIGEVVLRLY